MPVCSGEATDLTCTFVGATRLVYLRRSSEVGRISSCGYGKYSHPNGVVTNRHKGVGDDRRNGASFR